MKVYPTFNHALHRPVIKFHKGAIQFLNPVGDDCVGFVYGKGEREGNEVLLPKGTHFLYLAYFKNAKHGLFSEKSAKLTWRRRSTRRYPSGRGRKKPRES
ncbi:MAG: glycoside hydrolase 15-like protein [Candidatus Aramenus sulfurataquae]|jgi:hypothetical protein|uniref:Glycoside hydrolase 15-like protein n=2 Tax=Candidatus Aramenus sulfurataquae TaxID=1326980 RepID=W7L579_9CREN|nr:MAG: glycoside hydrolase 15-like protein [Candidatus Aramenus sulfurataquae]MCL7344566.1 hypothetical protein [Candidatus Aramenus sulfurataquae]